MRRRSGPGCLPALWLGRPGHKFLDISVMEDDALKELLLWSYRMLHWATLGAMRLDGRQGDGAISHVDGVENALIADAPIADHANLAADVRIHPGAHHHGWQLWRGVRGEAEAGTAQASAG